MKVEQFRRLMEEQFDIIRRTEEEKRPLYAKKPDRLCHFKDSGDAKGETPERALWGMWVKHYTAMRYVLDDIDEGKLPSAAYLNELIKDLVFYPILLKALILERYV